MINRTELFINGDFTPAHGGATVVMEASTGQQLGTGATADIGDVDRAVAAARAALPGWAATTPTARAEIMDRFAAALASRAESTATLVSRENGMPITLSRRVNGMGPAATVTYYADLVRGSTFEEIRSSAIGHTIVRRVPYGVVAAIAPWNYPQPLAMLKIAPALATGNTVVFKAAPETFLDAMVFADAAIEAGLPQGVLNIISGGREPSEYLVSHPGVDKVAFTGSTEVGRAIAVACGRLLRPVTLELGGKSAAIVLDDVDLDSFAPGLYGASFANNGQTCFASTRILAPRSRYAEIVAAVGDFAKSLVIGDALDPSTQIGPLATEHHRKRVLNYIDVGKASKARLIAGGKPVAGLDGWFVEPTVFADVDNNDVIAREEIFGPVLSIIQYDDEDHAVQIANASNYGLGGTVWSKDTDRATSIARRVETGTVGINQFTLDRGSPFGGFKASGLGRELGPEALGNYVQYQSIFKTGPGGAA